MTKPVTPQDMFELWQKMVNPGAYPLQSLMFPMPDSKEIEKKLAELEIVEHWLRANVNMVELTKKTLQYQLAMLKGGEKAQEVLSGKDKGAGAEKSEAPVNPAMWAWNMMAETAKGLQGETAPEPRAKKPRRKRGVTSRRA